MRVLLVCVIVSTTIMSLRFLPLSLLRHSERWERRGLPQPAPPTALTASVPLFIASTGWPKTPSHQGSPTIGPTASSIALPRLHTLRPLLSTPLTQPLVPVRALRWTTSRNCILLPVAYVPRWSGAQESGSRWHQSLARRLTCPTCLSIWRCRWRTSPIPAKPAPHCSLLCSTERRKSGTLVHSCTPERTAEQRPGWTLIRP